MNYSIIDFINTKTNNAYNFLKLNDIVYNRSNNKCIISFIYPESQNDLSEEEKTTIINLAKEFLNLSADIEVKIKKSYLEPSIINKFVINYFEKNHTCIFQSLNKNAFKIDKDNDIITLEFEIDSFIKDYFLRKGIETEIIKALTTNFCGKFFVKITDVDIDEDYYNNFIEDRKRKMEEISIATSYVSNIKKRFKVNVTKTLIGDIIDVDPEHLVLKEANNIIVAGKVKFLTLKSFKSKKIIKNEQGEDVPLEKNYFSFTFQDGNIQINAVYFPTKATIHKMNLLLDNENLTVLIKGDIEKFNEKYSLKVKDLSLCEILEDINDENQTLKKETENYNFIKPVKYNDTKQENLFIDSQKSINQNTIGKNFVVFDLETTGFEPDSCYIIEIGAVKICDGILTETFSCFVKPPKHISEESTAVHGITDEMVIGAHTINQVLPDFFKFTRNASLVAHNISFDYSFIEYNAKKLGYHFDNECIDTLALARAKLGGLKNHKLKNVCDHLGVSLVGAHRAVNDTIATAQVFLKLF